MKFRVDYLTIKKYMTKPGATPLVTISAKESNCKPKGPATLNNAQKKNHQKIKNIPKPTK
jgi:hypothetical protein